MIYLPLFGKDSIPQTGSRIIGLAGTFFLWIVVFIVLALINPKKEEKERYVTVQVVLSPEDHYIPKEVPIQTIVEETEGGEEAAKSVTEPIVQTVAEAKTTAPLIKNPSAPKPQSSSARQAQSTPSSKSYDTSSRAPVDYSTSVDDAFTAQLNGTKKAATWDESKFQDTANAVTSTPRETQDVTINKETSFSGSAGKVSSNNTSKTSTSNTSSNSTSEEASASTTQALTRISAASYSANSEGSRTTSSMNTSKSSNGKLQIQMNDGSMRTLIEPLYPSISLSKEASDSILEPKISVRINFRVNENGNVVKVEFANQSMLTELVRTEITKQIMTWRFESASFTSVGIFTYIIEKK